MKTFTYTHVDSSGIRWRMDGSNPISEIADQVMRDVGLVRKSGKKRIKRKAKRL